MGNRYARLMMLCAGAALTCSAAFADITIRNNSISLQEALAAVKKQGKVYVMYENGVVNGSQRIKLNLSKATLQDAVEEICSQAGL